ncbi:MULTISPECIES: hypothetical protein [Streptomyces]|uniref:DUF7739 domain-containing protein n=2 Tax=Streptomyces TaxID=1883 RepID=A0A124ECY1_9ACTN|nr:MULTISPECIES: hypothetical protein [Streptomyces]KUH39038.1 hypothetical protein ATE80_09510 [Streptomyces kanasensis]UUS34607.1 hypothetical protein NRO40_29850 [Streptomyces changanensis]
MGWTISHSTPRIAPSYTAAAAFAQHATDVLPSRKWRAIAHLFAPRGDGYFEISPVEAARMAPVFREAARHRLMPPDWADLAGRLATAADNAADNAARRGETWVWS